MTATVSSTVPLTRHDAWAREAVISPATTRMAQMGKVFGYLKGLHATHLIDLGTRLGLFRHLASVPAGVPPETLAAAVGLVPHYVRVWCEAACALELLDYEPAVGYRLAPCMDELLGQPEGTFYLGAFPDAHLQVARDYARYPALFRTGEVYPYQQHDAPFLQAVAAALRTLPRMFVEAVLPTLPGLQARLEAGATILDVGCGAGYALVEFAERYPRVRCVGLDVEATSIAMAQELIKARGLGDRVAVHRVEGTAWPADCVRAFDLVTTFLVLHEIHPDLKETVLRQCAQALRPDGLLLLFDEPYPSGPAELRDLTQIYAALAQWYELTWGNIVNTKEEIAAFLAQQGLRIVNETSLGGKVECAMENDKMMCKKS